MTQTKKTIASPMDTATTCKNKNVQAAYDETLSFVIKATRGKHPLSNDEAVNAAYLMQQSIASYYKVRPDELTVINTRDTSRLTLASLGRMAMAALEAMRLTTNPVMKKRGYLALVAEYTVLAENDYGFFDSKNLMDLAVKIGKYS